MVIAHGLRLNLLVAAALVVSGCGGAADEAARSTATETPAPAGLKDLVRAKIAAGDSPEAIAAGYGSLWVTNRYGGATEIDPTRNQVIKRIRANRIFGRSIAVGAGSVWVWVFAPQAGKPATLERLDERTGALQASIPIPFDLEYPLRLVFGGGYLWLYNGNDGNLYKVDPATSSVTERVKVSERDWAISVAYADGSVWTSASDEPIVRVDGRAMEVSGRVGGVTAVGLVSDGRQLWAAELGGGLTRIDTRHARVADRIDLGSGEDLQLALDGGILWARAPQTLYMIQAGTGKLERAYPIQNGSQGSGITVEFGSLWLVRGALDQVWRLRVRP
jgi:hypothetical protein